MNKSIIIFGSTGGIGSATCDMFVQQGCDIMTPSRDFIDFTNSYSHQIISNFLSSTTPDIIINCAGYLGTNSETHYNTMDINVGSNWSIIKHYLNNPPNKQTKIVMVGSSAYKSGRKDYMLYSASKAALYNLWQGACENFEGSDVSISLVNPVKTRTNMIDIPFDTNCLEPQDVADAILHTALTSCNQCIDMTYSEK